MDIFAPIAHRLGMGKLRGELEDLAFRHLHPEDYRELSEQLEKRRAETEVFLNGVTSRIEEKMREADVPFVSVDGRVKRLYSIWKKLRRQKISLDQVYDLVAARVITPNEIRHCYAALGVIHNTGSRSPGASRTGSRPHRNLYQSLHTSVIGSNSQSSKSRFELKTSHIAEKMAAHWKYKEGSVARGTMTRRCKHCARSSSGRRR